MVVTGSGCCKKCPDPITHDVTITYKYEKCPAPSPVVYDVLDGEAHIGAKGNLDILVDNLMKALEYNDRLRNTVRCYEGQIEEE